MSSLCGQILKYAQQISANCSGKSLRKKKVKKKKKGGEKVSKYKSAREGISQEMLEIEKQERIKRKRKN